MYFGVQTKNLEETTELFNRLVYLGYILPPQSSLLDVNLFLRRYYSQSTIPFCSFQKKIVSLHFDKTIFMENYKPLVYFNSLDDFLSSNLNFSRVC